MELLNSIGQITGLFQKDLTLSKPFIDVAARFSEEPGTVCLLSGGDLDCARYHILGLRPFFRFRGRGRNMEIRSWDRIERFHADPLDTLRRLLDHFRTGDVEFPEPFSSGLLGYLAYDLKDTIEDLPRTSHDDLGLPSIWFNGPSLVLVHDRVYDRTTLYIPVFEHEDSRETETRLTWFLDAINAPSPEDRGFSGDGNGFRSNFHQESYMDAIGRIKEYILSGDIYQVNMSQRFDMGFRGCPFSLFKDLFNRNPAPFFAYIHADDHHIVSTSPERFILRNRSYVETRPIKGTRPRGNTAENDEKLKAELSQSPKDDAELSMIVDLMRNDLGKVCKGGSVRVKEHKRVEAYTNVFHLISIVDGELDLGKDEADILRATFPGGSITGCPKIRSMEIIDELETRRRHIYTGSIGYIGFGGTLDLSIAIRTATIVNGRMVFSVGGGVVYDSDPSDEYHETLHKGRTLFDTVSGSPGEKEKPTVVWMNGGLMNADEASFPVTSRAAQYGHGLFETLRVDRGRIRYLDDHLKRLASSFAIFFARPFPDLTFKDVIHQVIDANRLGDRVAAVKIMIADGASERPPYDDMVIVTARPYTHRLISLNKDGLDLLISETRRHTPTAAHKSMNYQYYLEEGKKAVMAGYDEALILNADGSVSETNTANVFLVQNKTVVCPISEYALQGVMEKQVRSLLSTWSYRFVERIVMPSDFGPADMIFLTNSLMGAVPVRRIGERSFTDASPLCREINAQLL